MCALFVQKMSPTIDSALSSIFGSAPTGSDTAKRSGRSLWRFICEMSCRFGGTGPPKTRPKITLVRAAIRLRYLEAILWCLQDVSKISLAKFEKLRQRHGSDCLLTASEVEHGESAGLQKQKEFPEFDRVEVERYGITGLPRAGLTGGD